MTSSDDPIFFIDRCLGKSVTEALIAAGARVEPHASHFSPDAPDSEWLVVAGQRGWVVLTKDQAIGSNEIELKAIAQANTRVFALVSASLTRQEMADLFVDVFGKVQKFTQGNQSPFIAKIYRDGRVKLWKNKTQLLKLLKGGSDASINQEADQA